MSSFIMIQTLHYLVQITRFPKVKEDTKVIKEVFTTINNKWKHFYPILYIYKHTISVALDASLNESEFTIKKECISIYNKILKDF